MPNQKPIPSVEEAARKIKSIVESLDSALFSGRLSGPIQVAPKIKKGFSLGFEKNFLFFGPALFDLCLDAVVLSILHEMVHFRNLINGVRDLGRNSYHNKNFSSECARLGAFVIRHNNTGWSILSLYPPRNVTEENSVIVPEQDAAHFLTNLVHEIVNDFNWELFYRCSYIFRSKQKEYTYKYTCLCPPPYNSIRSGRGPSSNNPLRIRCIECGGMFSCSSR